MLFPNRPPAPEMRPGMGYAPGAHGMGYVAHMGYAPGARGLGDFSPSMENAAVDANIAPSDIDLLNSLGATDQDLSNLINGNVTLSQLYAQYGVTIPPSSTATANTAPASTVISPAAPVAQVPGGSMLLYTATVVGGIGDLTVTPTSAMSQFASALNAHGMTVTASSNNETVLNQVFGTGAAVNFQFQILDTVGNALVSDAKSVCDGVLQSIVGNNISTSNISVTSTPSGGGTGLTSAPITNSAVAWIENNAILIAGAVGGLILLNNLTGRRR